MRVEIEAVVFGRTWFVLGERGRRERFGARWGERLFFRQKNLVIT
jgi:hypothetical protein